MVQSVPVKGMAFAIIAGMLSVIALGLGCGSPVVCNCTSGLVVVPADTSRPLGVVLVDELECIAYDSGAVTGGRQVTVSRNGGGSCHVRATLWDNSATYGFTVEFQAPAGCCGTAAGTTVPQLVSSAAAGSI